MAEREEDFIFERILNILSGQRYPFPRNLLLCMRRRAALHRSTTMALCGVNGAVAAGTVRSYLLRSSCGARGRLCRRRCRLIRFGRTVGFGLRRRLPNRLLCSRLAGGRCLQRLRDAVLPLSAAGCAADFVVESVEEVTSFRLREAFFVKAGCRFRCRRLLVACVFLFPRCRFRDIRLLLLSLRRSRNRLRSCSECCQLPRPKAGFWLMRATADHGLLATVSPEFLALEECRRNAAKLDLRTSAAEPPAFMAAKPAPAPWRALRGSRAAPIARGGKLMA